MRKDLLGAQPVAANHEILDDFGRSDTTRRRRIVEYDVAAGHHMLLDRFIRIPYGFVNVTVDMD